MRTTINTIYSQIQSNLNSISSDIYKINSQISSGRQMSKLSDDPTSLVSALGMRSTVVEIAQYQENLVHGGSLISAAESSLRQIKDQVLEAKVIAISAQTTVMEPSRHLMAPAVANLLDQAVTLANTEIAGKYIFGGYRTSGYTDTEPAPFIHDLIDGYRINGSSQTSMDLLNPGGTVQDGIDLDNTVVPPGTLEFYFPDTTPPSTDQVIFADLTNPAANINGINMTDAFNLKNAINADTNVTASLTTQTGGSNPATAGGPLAISFDVTGSLGPATVSFTASGTATEIAQQTVDAINGVSDQTGVVALRGTGANGGVVDSVLFRNSQEGDESAITLTGPAAGSPEDTLLGFDDTNDDAPGGADINHNSGAISLSSTQPFTFGTTTATVLAITGLDTSTIAPTALDANGNPTQYGVHENGSLGTNDLKINGIWVPAAQDDGISSVDPALSAAAKATAINSIAAQTGVTAEVTPALVLATAPVDVGVGTLGPGDLIINGIDIFPAATPILALDSDNTIIETINANLATTGVYASRDNSGSLVLKAVDGRNLQVETSANGEDITHLNGAPPATAANQVSFGRLELLSNRTFMLESSVFSTDSDVYEPGLIALGLDGGTAITGEPTDVADDGKISVLTIADLEGNVRYAGDREEVLEIKVGKVEKIAISQNGQVALKNTQVFSALQDLEDTLLGKNFTEVTSLKYVTDVNATFASGATGLPNDPLFKANPIIVDGSFTINVIDHDHVPPETFNAVIPVDIATDTPATIAAKLDGIPGINASWNINGYLEVTSADPERYTFSSSNDSSNFTEAVRINNTDLQTHALNKSMADLDMVMEELTTQISDFGARGNRIDVQSQIFTNLDLAVQENLSDKQDTDILKAIMDLKAAENAYQAALASAARSMQMSLLDYL